MSEPTHISVDNNKYTVVLSPNGSAKVLRYGQWWQDITGDKFIAAMATELYDVRQENERMKQALKDLGEIDLLTLHNNI